MTESPENWGSEFSEVHLERREPNTLWVELAPKGRPVINKNILSELNQVPRVVQRFNQAGHPIDHLVMHSRRDGVFSLGGDLELFAQLIEERNEAGLAAYARSCVDIVYSSATGFGMTPPLMTYALIQGDALGGGMETALTADTIVMEEQARMGLPEVLFNLFPGMGAPSFLARKLSPQISMAEAEKVIISGNVYSAEVLHELGICHHIAHEGEGEAVLESIIQENDELSNARRTIRQVRQQVAPMDKQELLDIVDIWVEHALKLTARDLRIMNRLIARQKRV